MASFDELQNEFNGEDAELYSEDLTEAEFEGDDIDQCVEQAAEFFNTSRINLDWEVVEKGSSGFLGMGKKPFRVLVWRTDEINIPSSDGLEPGGLDDDEDNPFSGSSFSMSEPEVDPDAPQDGKVKVVIKKAGVFVTVEAPINGGREVSLEDVQLQLQSRNIKTYRVAEVKDIIREATGEGVKIADWHPNPDYDSKASIEIAPDEMKAYVTVTQPILSGRILEKNEIKELLEANEVVFGIMDDKIESIFEKELYNMPVLVAEGKPAAKGASASVEYKFQTEMKIQLQEDETGNVDYRNQNLVQNVVAGQVLAIKTPQTKGEPGRTITNKVMEAVDGEDIPFEAGRNTILSENGLEIIAQIAGRAILAAGQVSVDPIYEVKGDVDMNTGNIIFLGTVVVKGDISDGFTVKAAGNIEVKGNIGRAEVESDNEIIVGQGILGRDGGGIVKAGSNIHAKFIENANVSAGNDVLCREEILHSKVDAGGRIICLGKKGYIVGGRARAGYEISSKYLGSDAYPDTLLEAGVDPKYKEKLLKLEGERTETEEQVGQIRSNIGTLMKLQEAGKITEEKAAMLKRLDRAEKEFTLQLQEINEDIEELKNYLENLDTKGKISAKANVYPGVDLQIQGAQFLVKNDFKGVTFINENNFIKPVQYQPPQGGPKDEDKRH